MSFQAVFPWESPFTLRKVAFERFLAFVDILDVCLQVGLLFEWFGFAPRKVAFEGSPIFMNTLYMSLQIADSFVAMWTLEASIFSLSDLSQVSIWHLIPTSVNLIPYVLSAS
jgi:hypothetical protein